MIEAKEFITTANEAFDRWIEAGANSIVARMEDALRAAHEAHQRTDSIGRPIDFLMIYLEHQENNQMAQRAAEKLKGYGYNSTAVVGDRDDKPFVNVNMR